MEVHMKITEFFMESKPRMNSVKSIIWPEEIHSIVVHINRAIVFRKKESEVTQSCLTLWDTMDTRLLRPWDFRGKITAVGYHFLLQGSSRPKDQTQVSHIVDRRFTVWATREINRCCVIGVLLLLQLCSLPFIYLHSPNSIKLNFA